MKRITLSVGSLCIALGFAGAAMSTTYTDNFSGAQASLNWKALDYACLTAGSGAGTIPKCANISDTAGYGALRLTPAVNNQTGAILSNFTFPISQGLQVTFTTYTYGGNSGGTARNGADGITFFMTDGTQQVPSTAGALGGSLGYSCSNSNDKYEGLANAYLGLGIDEFGNFLNSGDNTSTGIYNSNNTSYGTSLYGSNSWKDNVNGGIAAGSGAQYQPMRIGLRGAGNLTWAYLKSLNSSYYSGSASKSKLTAACKTGKYVYDNNSSHTKSLPDYTNYAVIPGGYRVLPDDQKIAKESASTRAEAFPITYKITISPSGLLNFAYSYNDGAFQPVLANRLITQDNGPLPDSFRFGFSSGTGGSNNVHEITCFQASPLQSNSSAATNTIQSGEVKTGSQVYLATYTPDNWWGSVQSLPLVTTNNTLSISTAANWDAACVLTGGACPSMGTNAQGSAINTITAQAPSSRQLLTWNPTTGQGVGLAWANLTTAQQTALNGSDSLGQARLRWLRGVRSVEQLQTPNPGSLRARNKVLGDVIDSSPTFVGAPVPGTLPDSFADALYSNGTVPEAATDAQAYSAFVTAKAGRTDVVYVGANDGFIHGFEAGTYAGTGSYDSTLNDGKEVLGYMPAGLLSGNKLVNLTSPVYTHDFYVDATPAVGDLFYGNAWHTWLVGGVGSAGSEIFALDITDPANFSQANAASLVKGDWLGGSGSLTHLGKTVGSPIIIRMHSGQWAIVFGNGLSSGTSAGVYIGLVDSTTGAVTFQFLDTGVGSASVNNGIAYVTSADLDGDHIADYLYAGDLQGNVWRFDVTNKNNSQWSVSKFGANGQNFNPLFVAKDGSSNLQPITTAPVIASVRTGNTNRLMIFFGTGKKTPFTSTQGDQYATGSQTFYGIWDYDMDAWNGNSPIKYASLGTAQTISRAGLLSQSVVAQTTGNGNGQVLGYRTLSTSKKVCWKGATDCTTNNNQYGWYFDLPDTKEQIIYSPTIVEGAVVVNTAIPPSVSAIQCNPGLQTGWTMAFDPASGGGVTNGFFPGSGGGFGAGDDGSVTGGIRLDAVGTVTTVKYGGDTYIVTQTVQGAAALSKVNPPNNQNPSRVSWKEIRGD